MIKFCTTALNYLILQDIIRLDHNSFVQLHVEIPNMDNFCIQRDKYNKHFLIAEEIKENRQVCLS